MIQTVVKRDGRIVGFNQQKIMAAIRKAMLHTDKGEDETLIEKITDHVSYRGKNQMSVEAIQDAIEMAHEECPQGRGTEVHCIPQPA